MHHLIRFVREHEFDYYDSKLWWWNGETGKAEGWAGEGIWHGKREGTSLVNITRLYLCCVGNTVICLFRFFVIKFANKQEWNSKRK